MKDEAANGFRVSVKRGIIWDSPHADVEISGQMEIAITDRVIGLTGSGTCEAEIRWWIFTYSEDLQCKYFVGVYRDHYDRLTFTVRATERGYGGKGGFNLYWNSETGKHWDSKFY